MVPLDREKTIYIYEIMPSPSTACPSSLPGTHNSQVFGIVEGTVAAPTVTYLNPPLPVTPELLAAAAPVEPTEIFRFAGSCLDIGCQHYGSGQCQLARRIVQGLPEVTQTVPACAIRRRCRWWQQEGEAACLRCPQIVRTNYALSDQMRQVIAPDSPAEKNLGKMPTIAVAKQAAQ